MTDWPLHPVASLFRDMDAEGFAKLKDDIAAHGVLVPVTLWAGQLVDGRHRARACRELGIPCPSTTAICAEDELPALVWSLNAERRHLTTGERAMAAAKMANLKHGTNQHAEKVDAPRGASTSDAPRLRQPAEVPTRSREEAAKLTGVGRSTVDRALVVLKSGDNELIDKVERGDMPVATAAKIVRERIAPAKPKRDSKVIEVTRSPILTPPKIDINRTRTNALYAIQTQAQLIDHYADAGLPDETTCREWGDLIAESIKHLRRLQRTLNSRSEHERSTARCG